jgi:TolB-like protein/Tfp pilus assembly protein PilF
MHNEPDVSPPPQPSAWSEVWARIKEHKVAQWTIAYIAFAYTALHAMQMAREAFEWPTSVSRITLLVLLLGTPIAVTLAWYHGHRARRRISATELSILTVLLVIAGTLLWVYAGSRHSAESVSITKTVAALGVSQSFAPLAHSIAVLPFTDMSEKKDQEYFADGMAEEILDVLAKIPGLTVIGRTSSFQFKGKNEDLRTIGTQLNAAYLLEGSVRKAGDQVRITAQLVNARTGAHEWSETYDRRIGDVLKLQDAIAASVARELQLTVAPDYVNSRSSPKNAEVYDLYLRGRHAYDRHEIGELDEAATLFQRALDLDPTFADATVWLAWTKVLQGQFGYLAPAAAFEQGRRAAVSALKLDPKSAEAHAVLGLIHTVYDWDWAAAERELQQAMMLAPSNVNVLFVEAALSQTLGHWDDAFRQITAAIAQDPLAPDNFFFLSGLQANRGKLLEAETAMRRVLDIRPTFANAHYYVGLELLARGDRDAALLEMQQETDDAAKQQGLAIAYYALGRKMESDAALALMLKDQAEGNAVGIADVYAFRGQSDNAMHWLERAYAQKDPELYFIKSETELEGLKVDPRYKAFLRKMNLPE